MPAIYYRRQNSHRYKQIDTVCVMYLLNRPRWALPADNEKAHPSLREVKQQVVSRHVPSNNTAYDVEHGRMRTRARDESSVVLLGQLWPTSHGWGIAGNVTAYCLLSSLSLRLGACSHCLRESIVGNSAITVHRRCWLEIVCIGSSQLWPTQNTRRSVQSLIIPKSTKVKIGQAHASAMSSARGAQYFMVYTAHKNILRFYHVYLQREGRY